MSCYKNGDCGVYGIYSCFECPASKPEYLNKNKNKTIETIVDCKFCQHPFKHYVKYYISTEYPNDSHLYVLRKEDSIGGMSIKYCPLCGRKLDLKNNTEL